MHEQSLTAQQAAVAEQQAANAEQQALASAAETRLAAAKKRFIDGNRLTVDEVETLANASNANPSLTTLTDRIRGNTLLHLCARYGFQEPTLTLLRNGSDPEAGNGNGETPCDIAGPDTPLGVALRTPLNATTADR